jgi:hypothetical protein
MLYVVKLLKHLWLAAIKTVTYLWNHLLEMSAISRSSRKQSIVTVSSTKSEYIVLSKAMHRAKWVHSFLGEVNINYEEPAMNFEDNQVTIMYTSDQCTLRYMKHIDVEYHSLTISIEDSVIQLVYRGSKHMVADILMKPLPPWYIHIMWNN